MRLYRDKLFTVTRLKRFKVKATFGAVVTPHSGAFIHKKSATEIRGEEAVVMDSNFITLHIYTVYGIICSAVKLRGDTKVIFDTAAGGKHGIHRLLVDNLVIDLAHQPVNIQRSSYIGNSAGNRHFFLVHSGVAWR